MKYNYNAVYKKGNAGSRSIIGLLSLALLFFSVNLSAQDCVTGSDQVPLSGNAISNYTSGVFPDDVLFFEDFGNSPFPLTAENNFGRMTSPYMPENSFEFGIPYPNSNLSVENDIENNYYAVVSPLYIRKGWNPNSLGWYFWTRDYEGIASHRPLVYDKSGEDSGAVMVINAGNVQAPFYQRDAQLQMGASYKVSLSWFVVNSPSQLAVDVLDKQSGDVLGTIETSGIWGTSSDWEEMELYFNVPVETEACKIRDVVISFRNELQQPHGNDYYVDDLKVEKVQEAPLDAITLICPSPPLCSTSGVHSVNLNSLYSGTLPSDVVLRWFNNPNRTGSPVVNPNSVSTSGTYYAFFYSSSQDCYNTDNSTASVVVTIIAPCEDGGTTEPCTKPGNLNLGGDVTKVGISTLSTQTEGWPEIIHNGFLALESRDKGMVISRVSSSSVVLDPKEGMLVYDNADNCVKLYNGLEWKCIEKSCNE